jgi:hypothetical protein
MYMMRGMGQAQNGSSWPNPLFGGGSFGTSGWVLIGGVALVGYLVLSLFDFPKGKK